MIYTYEHPETGETIDIFQKMSDPHIYTDQDGVTWSRVWQPTNFTVDSKINPWSKADFIEKTGAKKGTVGDLWDKSEELSKQRAKESNGVDPVKQKFFKDYRKKRKGIKHPSDSRVS